MSEYGLTLTLKKDGSLELTDEDSEHMWSSDNDDAFIAEFGDIVEESELDDVGDWLEDNGHLENSSGVFYVVEGDEESDDD